ncbi:hypothetical protein SETIT_7G109900v2 [Setaria italica]|uniref:Uncharacterized protein n=1 Tax=Setaria italica TaxID=4555 RepID=A0A368RUG5_SETIT|nr:hypothetical protein SETIT_7G109900v2 [Setaria italica]
MQFERKPSNLVQMKGQPIRQQPDKSRCYTTCHNHVSVCFRNQEEALPPAPTAAPSRGPPAPAAAPYSGRCSLAPRPPLRPPLPRSDRRSLTRPPRSGRRSLTRPPAPASSARPQLPRLKHRMWKIVGIGDEAEASGEAL